jgi:1-acyl-sn-glycerol-3-phosphate acyltransferase
MPPMANHVEAGEIAAPAPRGPLNLLWGVAATGVCLLYTAVLALIAAAFAAGGRIEVVDWLSRLWGRLIIGTCGVRIDIRGLEHLEGLDKWVLVANHQSFFDIFAIVGYLPGAPRFVAKKELLKIPVIGYTLKRVGHVIVDRQAGGKAIRKATEVAKSGYHIVVFAEGHRYSDNRVHEFNDGAAWLAVLTKLPAVPMAISGTGAFFPRRARVVRPGMAMRMTIGAPISTEGLTSRDRSELTRKLEEAVRAMFVEEVE